MQETSHPIESYLKSETVGGEGKDYYYFCCVYMCDGCGANCSIFLTVGR